ncbi:MAG: NUDIX hydrolase [Cyclobacteriaceae bacterium]|nr:NUDIX hydrolase [Cyclobacteriaceae bacterium]
MKKPRITLDTQTFYDKGHEYLLSHLSIDCVIFGFHDSQLKVLLLEWKDTKQWCLPGGFIYKDEHIDEAANRILNSRTGLDHIHLQQFHTFGDPDRERGKHQIKNLRKIKENSWFLERFITIGYWALVEFSKVVPSPDELSSKCEWHNIDKIPQLVLDHNDILKKALSSLQQNLNEFPVGKELLPSKFTMPDLQNLYETILDKKLDRRNFQKKILALGILERLSEQRQGGAHKAPFLYRFNPKKYQHAMKHGLRFGLS